MNISYSTILKILAVIFFFWSNTTLFAQNGVLVGPTTGTAHASAMLEVNSTNKGFLLPRVNLVALNNGISPVNGPAPGLLVYNLGAGGVPAVGVYYWDGSANAWVQLTAGGMSGSGTTNYVTKWTSSTSLGNSQIFDDGTNVGVNNAAPTTRFQVAGEIMRTNTRVDNAEKYPVAHGSDGSNLLAIDPSWTNAELQAYFNNANVQWSNDASAPGGYAIQITGAVNVGGEYGSGFPYIPVDNSATYYMECWIRSGSGTNNHYMGSNEYNENFASLGGNPGSYGYWTMSNTVISTSWTKVSGYISGFDAAAVGKFELGTKYWTPMALFNYVGAGPTYISGWKVTAVSSKPIISTAVQYAYTGADQTFTVPANVYSIQVDLYGAAGGNGSWGGWNYGWSGGPGGYTHGTIAVTPGQVLTVIVGQGGAGGATSNATFSYGGGGRNCNGSDCQYAAKGGGRSAIRSGSTELLTAGGGGGGGSCVNIGNSYRMNGGAGGGLFGSNSINEYSGQVATGGSQTAGGTGMPGNVRTGTNGSQFTGGTPGGAESYGGGGGGGWYGGGGGNYYSNAMGGGAGGSGYISGPGVTNAWTQTGGGAQPEGGSAGIGHGNWPYFGRNGLVIISY